MSHLPAHFMSRKAVTLIEVIVVAGILVVLAAIFVPSFSAYRTKVNQAAALANMKSLTSAFATYTSNHDGLLPGEDASNGGNTWAAAADPLNAEVWYNALPRLLNQPAVGDYTQDPAAFYSKSNVLFFPGAKYPSADGRLSRPLFAVAINSRLQRKNEDGSKDPLRVQKIVSPSRTAIFFEQGLKDEKQFSSIQSRFDGAPKGTAKSLVGRYAGRGIIAFVDGHAELFAPKDLITPIGTLPFPQTDVIWTPDPATDPN